MTTTVLVVDDDQDIRDMLTRMLQDDGLTPVTASCGREGVEALQNLKPDLIVTDVIMPDMDGIELLQNARKMTPCARALVISGGGRIHPDIYLNMALKLGAQAILRKPFSKGEFLDAVHACLKGPALCDLTTEAKVG